MGLVRAPVRLSPAPDHQSIKSFLNYRSVYLLVHSVGVCATEPKCQLLESDWGCRHPWSVVSAARDGGVPVQLLGSDHCSLTSGHGGRNSVCPQNQQLGGPEQGREARRSAPVPGASCWVVRVCSSPKQDVHGLRVCIHQQTSSSTSW